MSADPTSFAIDFDPTVRRMRGYAVHGNTPFDVPFVSAITDDLWQGGCEDGMVLPRDVRHLISLYPWEQYTVEHELDSSLSVRLYDSVDQEFDAVTDIARWVNRCRKTGVTLVHCQAGLNRSALVAATALILDGTDPGEAVALLRSKRSPAVLCNPAFVAWLISTDLQ